MFNSPSSSTTVRKPFLNQVLRFKTLYFTVCCLLFGMQLKGQLSTNSPTYTGCPNQIITVTASWPNVSITGLNLGIPTGGSATNNGNLQSNTTFTISYPGPPPSNTTWTLVGTGIGSSGVVTNTIYFQLSIQAPPALTFTNQLDYCPGGTATIVATPGGNYYTVVGPQNLGSFQTNVFIVPNLTQGHNGVYTVTSIGTCTLTGTTTINIAPSSPLTINTTSNVCEGQSVNLTAGMPGGQNYQWFNMGTNALIGTGAIVNTGTLDVTGAGGYKVEVTQQYGVATCVKTATTQINVVATNPVGASASPGNHLCQNDKLTLTANAGNNVAGYTWQGPCNFQTSIANPTISPVIPCNSGNYTVTALFTNNFVSCTETAVVNVTVVPTAVPNPSVPNTVCENAKVQLTASGSNVFQWVWYGPNFSSNQQNPIIDSIKPSSSGPYVVTAIYTLPAITKTCAVSSPPQQLSVIAVNSVAVIPPKPVCVPDNAHFSASSPGAVAYEWKSPNSSVVYNGANMTLYYPPPSASGIYTVTAYFGSLLCPRTNTAELTVNPVLNFSLIPRQLACYNFSVAVPGPSGADSYTWTSSTGFTSNSKDLYLNSVQPKDAGNYTLSISLGPCITKAATEVAVVSPIQFTLTPKSRTVCLGDTVVLEAGVTGGSENYAYSWNPPLYMDSPNGPYKVFVPLGSVQYNLMVHDVACAQFFTLGYTFKVQVDEAPNPVLNQISARGCDPFCQLYEVATDSMAGIVTLDFGGLDQYQTSSKVHCLPGPGSYTLNITTKSLNGCTGKYTYPYPIIVDPRPGSEIIYEPNPATTSEDVKFTAKHDNNVVYQSWLFMGGKPAVIDTSYKPSSSDTTQDLTPSRRYDAFGKYPVMLVAQNEYGCWDTIYQFIDVIDVMSVYIPDAFTPNDDGINDGFKVKGQGMQSDGFIMDIFNRKGQIVFSTKDIDEAWDGTYHNVKCEDGVYTYKIRIVGMNGEGRKEYVGKVTLLK